MEHNGYGDTSNTIQGAELHMPKMFGTDSVRELANRGSTTRLVLDLGGAVVHVLDDTDV